MKIDLDALLEQAAANEGISEHLPVLRKMLQAESGGNAKAVSPKGAMGAMQLMPETAKELEVTDPFDPVQNIQGGVKYFKRMLQQFGDPVLAVAAYNAGPGNVQKYGGVPPFKETQQYIARIFGKVPPDGYGWKIDFGEAGEEVDLEASFLERRKDQEFINLLDYFSPAKKEPPVDVVSRAIPRWATGSGLDWLERFLSSIGKAERPRGEPLPGESAMAIAPPKQEPLQARYATEEEWRQMDPEGYQRYQEYLRDPEKPGQVRLIYWRRQVGRQRRRESSRLCKAYWATYWEKRRAVLLGRLRKKTNLSGLGWQPWRWILPRE